MTMIMILQGFCVYLCMMHFKHWQLGLLILGCVFVSCSVMGKNPKLTNTKWTAIEEMFVADAGTMTITRTLEFTSAEDVLITEKTHMPSYPAMYMNPDGTIDTIQGWDSEHSEKGTYEIQRNTLVITTEDGTKTEYAIKADGTFTYELPYGEVIEFSRVIDE